MSFIGDFFGRIFGSSSYRKKLLNPVLNDPKDVTPKVIEKILNNSLESITINYNMKLINEFKFDDEEFNSRTLHFFSPFSIAELNNKTGAHVEAISYPIIFGEKVTNISGLFNKLTSLKNAPEMNTSKIKRIDYLFSEATSLETIPNYDFSNVVSMKHAFEYTRLIEIPLFNTSKTTDMSYLFRGMFDLNKVPLLDKIGRAVV